MASVHVTMGSSLPAPEPRTQRSGISGPLRRLLRFTPCAAREFLYPSIAQGSTSQVQEDPFEVRLLDFQPGQVELQIVERRQQLHERFF